MSKNPLAHLDHSLLSPGASWTELEAAAQEAIELGVAALCILPWFVPRAVELLRGTAVATCTVVAFPHGATSTTAKLREAEVALEAGAAELDLVVNLSLVRSSRWGEVETELAQLNQLAHQAGAKTKWILETAALDDETIRRLCLVATEHGADWVKTSTGFGPGGATAAHVALLRESCPPRVQVKASGGIRSLSEVEHYLELGASRVGTSRSGDIARELRARGS